MLKPGVFYRLDSVESHLAFREHNPVEPGARPGPGRGLLAQSAGPALEEPREEAGRLLIDAFVRRRLIPLGCVRAAIDDEGRHLHCTPTPLRRLFRPRGRPAGLAPAAEVAARVVVQPDFSVIVIGLNPAPAAELAPFCERASAGSGQGAMVLKITRESVVKAVSQGLETRGDRRPDSSATPATRCRPTCSGKSRNGRTGCVRSPPRR